MITINDVKQVLVEKGVDKTDAEIQAQIDLYDFSALINTEKAKYTVEIWDKVSQINGVDADTILQGRTDIPDNGEIYLIKQDGVVKTFQPHNPNKVGCEAMTEQEATSIANTQINRLAESVVDIQVLQQIVDALSQ